MNRPVTETTPDGKVRTYEYNKAGLLEKVRLDSAYFVDNIDYNEKGQRILIDFGNNTTTNYHYDLKNFRLIRLVTTRGDNPTALLQDLNYIYDPEGNIVEQADNAQQTFYFDNSVINPVGKYEYDALYRLVKAQGRELGALGMGNQTDCLIKPLGQNQSVLNNYTQLYAYDNLGNIQSVRSVINPWVRTYQYDTATNRLLNTGAGYNYTYDAHGNMISMPHLTLMEWDYKGNLVKTIRTGNGYTTYYRYDSQGNRVRKVYIHDNITEERIYIGNYELYRKKVNGTLETERQTAFVSDDTKRIAIIDTCTTPSPVEVTIRYQYDNHLGSASLELDSTGDIISYEEYYPFGNTSYRAGRNDIETSLKRYRYVGKERDEETGLYYYGARYYAAWLCRFVSVDPLQFEYSELTPFQYASNRPITGIDLDGLEFYANSDGIITGKGSDEKCRNVYYVDKYNEKGEPETYYDLNVTIEEYAGFASLVWNESSGDKEESFGIANSVANYVLNGGHGQLRSVKDIVLKENSYSSVVLQKKVNEYANSSTNRYEFEAIVNALMRVSYPDNHHFKDNSKGSNHWDGPDLIVGLDKKGDCAPQSHRKYTWSNDSKEILQKYYNSFSVSERKLSDNDIAFNTSVYIWNWKYSAKDADIQAIMIMGKTIFEKIKYPGEGYNAKAKNIDYSKVVNKILNKIL